jgi:hypothetical protein
MTTALIAAALVAAIFGWIWYTSRKSQAAENAAADEKALREAEEIRLRELEAQVSAANAAAHEKDVDEGTRITNGTDAIDFLRNSFGKNGNR